MGRLTAVGLALLLWGLPLDEPRTQMLDRPPADWADRDRLTAGEISSYAGECGFFKAPTRRSPFGV